MFCTAQLQNFLLPATMRQEANNMGDPKGRGVGEESLENAAFLAFSRT